MKKLLEEFLEWVFDVMKASAFVAILLGLVAVSGILVFGVLKLVSILFF